MKIIIIIIIVTISLITCEKLVTGHPMMPSSTIPQSSIPAVPPPLSPSTSSPCAACKFLRRKCQPDCVFAPYFPPDNPQKFVHVHRVFGASNVTKILNEIPTCHREDAVNSLAYEADMRLKDPVYGCVGVISILQHQLRQLQFDLHVAKAELQKYQNPNFNNPGIGFGILNGAGGAAAAHANYYQQQQHNVMMRNYEVPEMTTVGMAGNGGQFLKTGMNVNGGEERLSVGPST